MLAIEQYVSVAERVVWDLVVFYYVLRTFIRSHKK